jgi:heavy metal sensor kinase
MKSSRTRFLLAFFLAELVLVMISIPRMHVRNERAWQAHTDQLLRDKAVILASSLDPAGLGTARQAQLALEAELHQLVWQIFDARGRMLRKRGVEAEALPLPNEVRTNLVEDLEVALRTVSVPGHGRFRVAVSAVRANDPNESRLVGFAQVGLSMAEHQKRAILRLGNIALGGTVFSLLLLGVVAWLSNRWLTSLRAIAESARQLGEQELPRQRLPVSEKEPELAEFARACNQMLERIETAYATRQQFIADAAHQLRTPLTILRGEIDVALRRERDPERYRQVLNSNREEIERLCRLLDSLLLLARADAGKAIAPDESIELTALCRDTLEKIRPLADQQGITLEYEGGAEIFTRGDRVALEHVLSNLVDNALQHTPAGESVKVGVAEQEGGAIIKVVDAGRGIPAEALPHIFKRFYRVEGPRALKRQGAGLGLAIVKALTEAHGGRVTVESKLGEGSTVAVWLPVKTENSAVQ